MKSRRVAAGMYEVDTKSGTYQVEYHASIPTMGEPAMWTITYPNRSTPDAQRPTKRDALVYIALNEGE